MGLTLYEFLKIAQEGECLQQSAHLHKLQDYVVIGYEPQNELKGIYCHFYATQN